MIPPSSQPDPAQGVFETLLVVEGEPIELEAHLSRLGTSLRTLFDLPLPPGAHDLICRRAEGLGLGRLRLTVVPTATGLTQDVATSSVDPNLVLPEWEDGADLLGRPLAGGLGSHKWVDRSALEGTAPGTVPLLLDRADEVLEAGWANVFAVHGDVLWTPCLDGRILPGISRGVAIEVARADGYQVVERRLHRDELLDADEVFLTGSVRGLTPARSLDGVALGDSGELSRQVAAGLRRRWLDPADAVVAPALAGAPRRDRPAR